MLASAARQIGIRMEKVDANGLLPMRAAPQVYSRAFDFRRFLQKALPAYLIEYPESNPLKRLPKVDLQLPAGVETRWPRADLQSLSRLVAALPLDHGVPATESKGGPEAARQTWRNFLRHKLSCYPEQRNQPEKDGTSGLSPYIHFGHISVHQIFSELIGHEGWHPGRLSASTSGKRTGWWGLTENAEAFLDQLVTWNMCHREPTYNQYTSLPAWAQKTLAEHAGDPRNHIYSLSEFERAATHDPLWNAAQNQLLREGRIHNYLRMLWGKKILEWSATPQAAIEIMIELNDKHALDGRNPNSYSGIFWTLGRYDRAWGPERPVFGKIRFMSSENTARKFRVDGYIRRYS
jgi:deoxyribodipyrimidine photo-lyase